MRIRNAGIESNIKHKTFRMNEIIENKMKEYKINGTVIRNLIEKHIEQLEKQKQMTMNF